LSDSLPAISVYDLHAPRASLASGKQIVLWDVHKQSVSQDRQATSRQYAAQIRQDVPDHRKISPPLPSPEHEKARFAMFLKHI